MFDKRYLKRPSRPGVISVMSFLTVLNAYSENKFLHGRTAVKNGIFLLDRIEWDLFKEDPLWWSPDKSIPVRKASEPSKASNV